MSITDEPQKHVKMPDEPLEIDEEDFYVRAFIKWAIEEQPELKRLEAENAKLRELVRDMHAVISDRNSWWDCMRRDTKHFADRMCELGVEYEYNR